MAGMVRCKWWIAGVAIIMLAGALGWNVARGADAAYPDPPLAITSEGPLWHDGWYVPRARISSDGSHILFSTGYQWQAGEILLDERSHKFYNRATGTIVLADIAFPRSADDTAMACFSDDRRYAVEVDTLREAIPGDRNRLPDIYLYDLHDLYNLEDYSPVRISRAYDGGETDGESESPIISGNGKVIAFLSRATNLTVEDRAPEPKGWTKLYLHDVTTKKTMRVPLEKVVTWTDLIHISDYALSRDGRYLACVVYTEKEESRLVHRAYGALLLYDRQQDTLTSVCVDDAGKPLPGESAPSMPVFSADGHYLVFKDRLPLATNDTNACADIYRYDLHAGKTEPVSLGPQGEQAESACTEPATSADGRFSVYASGTIQTSEIYLRDMERRTTTCISAGHAALSELPYHLHANPSISADGRFVCYATFYTNIDPGSFTGRPDDPKWKDRIAHAWVVSIYDRETGKTSTPITVNNTEKEGLEPRPFYSDTTRIRAAAVRIDAVKKAPTDEDMLRLYREVYPGLSEDICIAFASYIPHPDPNTMSLDAYADAMIDAGLHDELYWHLRTTCCELFSRHPKAITPEIEKALRGNDNRARRQALDLLFRCKLPVSVDTLINIFRQSIEDRYNVATLLSRSGDSRVIPLLMQDTKHPLLYFEQLRFACRKRPAPPALLALLSSTDPNIRRQALHALAESGDPALIPYILRLVKDPNAEIRNAAANTAFCLPDEHFVKVRPAMVALLQDRDDMVASMVACYFAQRKDPVCLPAMLRLLKGNRGSLLINIVSGIESLTGMRLAFTYTHEGRLEDTVANREALAAFAKTVPGADMTLFLPCLPDREAALRRAHAFLDAAGWSRGEGSKTNVAPPPTDPAWGADVWVVKNLDSRLVLDRYSGLIYSVQGPPASNNKGTRVTAQTAAAAARKLLAVAGVTLAEYRLERNAPRNDGKWQVLFRRYYQNYPFMTDTASVILDPQTGRLHELTVDQPSPRPASLEMYSNKQQAINSVFNFMGAQGWRIGEAWPASAELKIVRPTNYWDVQAGRSTTLKVDYQHPRLAWVVVLNKPWQYTEIWYAGGWGIIGGGCAGPLAKGCVIEVQEN